MDVSVQSICPRLWKPTRTHKAKHYTMSWHFAGLPNREVWHRVRPAYTEAMQLYSVFLATLGNIELFNKWISVHRWSLWLLSVFVKTVSAASLSLCIFIQNFLSFRCLEFKIYFSFFSQRTLYVLNNNTHVSNWFTNGCNSGAVVVHLHYPYYYCGNGSWPLSVLVNNCTYTYNQESLW